MAVREYTVPLELSGLDQLLEAVEERLSAQGCPTLLRRRLWVAMEELFQMLLLALPEGERATITCVPEEAGSFLLTWQPPFPMIQQADKVGVGPQLRRPWQGVIQFSGPSSCRVFLDSGARTSFNAEDAVEAGHLQHFHDFCPYVG